ncbi:MAG: metal ABC transporter permease [Planctomycetota bacterium]
MTWTSLDSWIVVAGAVAAASCALLGNFLLLRKLSMMGDAISHAVLPGIATAFLLTQSRSGVVMLIGAAVVGLLTAAVTEWIHGFGKVDESASMGVVFTTLFAMGLILIVRAADAVDLDPGCVLFGAIELVPLDTVSLACWTVPRSVVTLTIVLTLDVAFVLFFFKELKISAFDPALATSLGISARLMHYLLVIMVAVTTVASFEAVGSILVIAMLVVPAATAHLLTDRLGPMLVVSVVTAVFSAVAGHLGAITVPLWFGVTDTSTSGMIAVAAGCCFFCALFVAPRHGVLSRIARRLLLAWRILSEDCLGLLYRLEEIKATATSAELRSWIQRAGGIRFWMSALSLRALQWSGKVRSTRGTFLLTPVGREQAGRLIRSHRLWESFLAKHLGLPEDHLHLPAERVEHFISETMREVISADLQDAKFDPHGHPIPRSSKRDDGPVSP